MGDTISSLVYRPPTPTPIDPNEFFYLDIDIESPLCSSTSSSSGNGAFEEASCGSCMSLDTGEADLKSLDRSFFAGRNNDSSSRTYKIPAFFVRRRGANRTLLFSHGNAEDLGMMYKRMKDLALVLCVNILAYDYTGYGLSTGGGGPSENMIYRNIEAAYKYLRVVRNIPASQIILYGRSLGSGPSCYLASKTALEGDSVGGLILHSPFLSVYKVVADFGFHVAGDLFNNEKRAVNIRCPTLIIHGKKDEVVPFWHAPRLLQAIPPEYRAQPFWVEGLGHNHIESRIREHYLQVVSVFITKYVPLIKDSNSTAVARPVIPVDERPVLESDIENSLFHVNKTWIRHAKQVVKGVWEGPEIMSANASRKSAQSSLSSTSSFQRRRSRGQALVTNNGDKYTSTEQYLDDSRDDENEFSPWMNSVTTRSHFQPEQDIPRYQPEQDVSRNQSEQNITRTNLATISDPDQSSHERDDGPALHNTEPLIRLNSAPRSRSFRYSGNGAFSSASMRTSQLQPKPKTTKQPNQASLTLTSHNRSRSFKRPSIWAKSR
mmetsp:Transcript_12810/g.26061  ORF Transcript_12810/g.26061 Transcript_12810/m.26061 type:complete len:547 (+) Transcript_12810:97-1737(+)